MLINATGGTGELVTCVLRPGRCRHHLRRLGHRILSFPAFWFASGDPASRNQHGRSEVDWKDGVLWCGRLARRMDDYASRWRASIGPGLLNPWSARYPGLYRVVPFVALFGGVTLQQR